VGGEGLVNGELGSIKERIHLVLDWIGMGQTCACAIVFKGDVRHGWDHGASKKNNVCACI
jgi:hypothetical protein